MKLEKKYAPEKLAGRGIGAAWDGTIYIDPARRVAVSTDGRAMAVVPVVTTDDAPGVIPAAAVADARRASADLAEIEIDAKAPDTARLADGRTYPRLDVDYPDWAAIDDRAAASTPTATVMLDAQLLLDAATAIGAGGRSRRQRIVRLDVYGPGDPVRITADDARAFVMPCALPR